MTISPALRYRDAKAAIAWLSRAFGFETQAEYAAPDGSIAHAELRLGTGVLGISSAQPVPSPENPWTTVRQGVYVALEHVDQHHDRAKAAGAEIATPLKDMDYGSREYAAWDIGRQHLWGFGTYGMVKTDDAPSMFVGLHFDDGRAAIDWLSNAFGFRTTLEIAGANGAIDHAELALGDGVVMVSSTPRSLGLWGNDNQALYVAIPDPDAHYARAQAAGASIVQAPRDTLYGARGYYARDPEGFLWGFSTYRPKGIVTSGGATDKKTASTVATPM
jgi:uncharacterized glyoxalase superfamily protein PhnB